MKKHVMSLIAVWGLAAAVSPLFAQSTGGFKATVPFDFQVGDRTMPAGVYIVEPGTSHVSIRNAAGTARAIQLSRSTEGKGLGSQPEMVFTRYGTTAFLARILLGGTAGHQLQKTKLETELAQKWPQTEVATSLVASGGR